MTIRNTPILAIDMHGFEATLNSKALSQTDTYEIIEDIWDMLYDFAAYGFVLRQLAEGDALSLPILRRPPYPKHYLVTVFNSVAKRQLS